ncbi:MAG: T9SS type A sorting domain-containing protein, partial [Marinilabiliaceae bacterium]|nr:T9SS type A sorting domain-containing protein [Marinilabiliaceae bacterium]
YVITWTFADGNGNSSTATQNVVVDDVTAPVAPTLTDATGECSVTVTAPTAEDNCAGTVTGTTTDPLTYTTQGSYVITWTFADGNGNSSTATQNVVVDDVTAPVAPTLTDATGECTVTVTAPTAEDNCAGTVTGTTTDPLTYTTQGSYVITWTFTDGNGNSSTATQNVVVDDVTAPTFEISEDKEILITTGQTEYIIQGDEFDPKNVIDNCTNYTVSNNLFEGTTLEGKALSVGQHTIIWTVTDAGENAISHSFIVTITTGTGCEDISRNNIIVYPNPVTGSEINIDLGSLNGSVIEIISVTGNMIKAVEQTGVINTVDVGELSIGTYFVRVRNNAKVYTLKFIKK